MNKLELAIDTEGLNIDFGGKTISTDIAQVARYGLLPTGKPSRANVQWTVDKIGFNYLMQVYRAHEASGHAPFLIDLLVKAEVKEVIASILPGSFGLKANDGESFIIGATLEFK